jgi:hypothetical protein
VGVTRFNGTVHGGVKAVLQCCYKEVPSLVKAVTVVTCIWGASSSNFDRINEYCDRLFCSFPQTDVRMVLELTPLLFPDTSFHFIIYQSAIRHCMVSTADSVVKWTINVLRFFCGSPAFFRRKRLSPYARRLGSWLYLLFLSLVWILNTGMYFVL